MRIRFIAVLSTCLLLAACTRSPHGSGERVTEDEEDQPRGAPTLPAQPAHPTVVAPNGPGPGNTEPLPPTRPVAGGLVWEADPPLVQRRPQSNMRAAEYGVEGHDGPASLAVFYFGQGQGGSVQDNVDRWVAQLSQPDGRPSSQAAHITHKTVSGLPVTLIDVSGTFGGGGMPGMPTAPTQQAGWRLLGAIAEGPNGAVFFKLTGPADAVDAAEQSFGHLVDTLQVVQGG